MSCISVNFMMNYMSGNLQRRFTSSRHAASTCASPNACVVEVTAATFDEVVLEEDKVSIWLPEQVAVHLNPDSNVLCVLLAEKRAVIILAARFWSFCNLSVRPMFIHYRCLRGAQMVYQFEKRDLVCFVLSAFFKEATVFVTGLQHFFLHRLEV